MNVWICSMYNCSTAETTTLGVFTTLQKALKQGEVWLEGVANGAFRMIDSGDNYYYYCDSQHCHYTVYLEEFKLDEISY